MSSTPRTVIYGSHLVFTGYAHWLPNDLRGSGSAAVRRAQLADLGKIHQGRRLRQPSRDEVRRFFREAERVLMHDRMWWDAACREVIANAFGDAADELGYTIRACAVCSNHAHVVVRMHRDRSETIWGNLAERAKLALQEQRLVLPDHPVWSQRPYKVFLFSPERVVGAIDYVNDNPEKEGLPRQYWDFVKLYVP